VEDYINNVVLPFESQNIQNTEQHD